MEQTAEKELTIVDLIPAEGEVFIAGETFKVRKASMKVRIEICKKYGIAALGRAAVADGVSNTEREEILSDLVWRLLDAKGREKYPNIDSFRDAVTTREEVASIMLSAALVTGGASLSGLTAEEVKLLSEEKKTEFQQASSIK